jgi:hypothetical protein
LMWPTLAIEKAERKDESLLAVGKVIAPTDTRQTT